jgi:hypothetical protein
MEAVFWGMQENTKSISGNVGIRKGKVLDTSCRRMLCTDPVNNERGVISMEITAGS